MRNSGIKISNTIELKGMRRLGARFYTHTDVVYVAKALIGKVLVTNINNIITAGRIVETEAYNGVVDKASHAYGGRRTNRTEIMYSPGGVAYVYLCYGIHYLFNIVTNKADVPHAVLVRAVEPVTGMADMLLRTGKQKLITPLPAGPAMYQKR